MVQHKHLSKVIVFKGGTVLKKFYFSDYRFSEDLDFTLLDNAITNEQIFVWFNETFEFVMEEANIAFAIIDDNKHEDGGINFYISHIGPLGGLGSNKKVKVDISRSEKMEFDPVDKEAYIEYSDLEKHHLLCYRLEKVLVEKMRSVMQRMQARDFYDIWSLLEVPGMDVEFYSKEFTNKCSHKVLNPRDFQKKLTERLPQCKGRWKTSMNEQIQNLPDFDKVEKEVQRHLKKLKL